MFRRFPAAALVVLATLVLASCARIPPGVCSQFKTGALDMTALGDDANTKFLADFDARPDVVKTASGLRYRVLASGTGAQPRATDTVRAHYRGTLIDCTVFDSSYERGPATFPVNRLIPGWVEALQLMHIGDVWELVLPYQLAYGEAGAGADIPPRQTLVFQLELLEVK